MKKVDERVSYVKDKAKMFGSNFCDIHNTEYKFDVNNVIDDRVFKLFTNLKKEYKDVYITLLLQFLNDINVKSDTEKLVWTSEFLDILNKNHNTIFK